MSSKPKALFFPFLFEFYYFSAAIVFSMKHGLPSVISFFIKVGLGYLAYRLYISRNKKNAVLGLLLVLVLIIAPYIVFFINPAVSETVGGYPTVLLTANTLFFLRYWRQPDIIIARWESQNSPTKSSHRLFLLVLLMFTLWASIEVLVGVESGARQLGMALFWLGFYASAEGMDNPKDRKWLTST